MRIEEHRNVVFFCLENMRLLKVNERQFGEWNMSATGYLVYSSTWMYVVSSSWFNASLPSEMCTTMCSIIITTTRADISVNYLNIDIFLLFTYFYATSQTLTPCLQCACQTFVLVCLDIYLSVFLAKCLKCIYTLPSTLSSPVSYCRFGIFSLI